MKKFVSLILVSVFVLGFAAVCSAYVFGGNGACSRCNCPGFVAQSSGFGNRCTCGHWDSDHNR